MGRERDHDFHIMTFCTIGKEGVEARSVVLRDFDKNKNIIRFPRFEVQNLMILRKTQTQFAWCIVIAKQQLRIKTISSIITMINMEWIMG